MGLRYNPPPGWPPPPEGFAPGPGWHPDPSWPAPPPGWQLWVDDDQPPGPDPRPTSRWAIAALVFGVVGGILVSIICGVIALTRIRRLGQKGRGMAIAGLVLSGAWIVIAAIVIIGVSVGHATRSDTSGQISRQGKLGAFSLVPGDCFDNPRGARILGTVTALPCGQPHNAQVYAKFRLSGSDFSFPGTAKVARLAVAGCNARVGNIDKAKTTSVMTVRLLYPEEGSWIAGQRAVSCFIVNPTATLRTSLVRAQPAG